MIPLFIGTMTEQSGKNMITLGLAVHFKRQGFKVGGVKPYGLLPMRLGQDIVDEEAKFFYDALELDCGMDCFCPVVLTAERLREALKQGLGDVQSRIVEAFRHCTEGADVGVVGGIGRPYSGATIGLPAWKLVEALDARVMIVDHAPEATRFLDRCLAAADQFGERLIGVVINRATPGTADEARHYWAPFLERNGVHVLGIVQTDPVLSAVPIAELRDALHAQVLCGADALDELVERLAVGAMNIDAALRYFRKIRNKAVLTGGDRADIQLAALETSTRCLILTGGTYPNDIILGRAIQERVPVMVVQMDTASAVEVCDSLLGRVSLVSPKKIDRAVELVEAELDLNTIYKAIGLERR